MGQKKILGGGRLQKFSGEAIPIPQRTLLIVGKII